MMFKASLSRRSCASRSRAVLARCEPPKTEVTVSEKIFNPDDVPTSTSQGGMRDMTGVQLDVPDAPVQTAVLGRTQELINSRAAMLGFVAAAGSEILSGQSVWSQIAGKYIDGEVVEKAHGNSTLFFGAMVVIITMATLAPKFLGDNPDAEDKEFGPFTATAEVLNGRVAMMGFLSLLVVEFFKQSAVF